MTKRTRDTWIGIGVPCVFLFLLWFGPPLIHFAYRVGTSEEEKDRRKNRYHFVAAKVAYHRESLPSDEFESLRYEQRYLFHWFHARGLNIDEGWHETAFEKRMRAWRELYWYWKHS